MNIAAAILLFNPCSSAAIIVVYTSRSSSRQLTVKVEAQGFESQQADNVSSGLGQKQTVNLTPRVAQSKQTVDVSAEAPIINTSNPNTSTTLAAPALENLPNPGGDMTYPLQFTPGALINTAGSGNDFVGGTNGYGKVEFNGLPALSNGYIVMGWRPTIH